MDENKRGSFGSTIGFLLSAIGSAVGLGNIWGFPYKMGRCGGFTFLIVYLALAAFVGFAIMLSELAIGRSTGFGPVNAYKKVSKKFKWIGWLAIIAPFLIMTFYSVLGGYCIYYMIINVVGMFSGMPDSSSFGALLTNPWASIGCMVLFMLICYLINRGGVGGGIEKFNTIGMPALFVMLVIVIIRAWTLPNADVGLKYMFVPGYALKAGFFDKAPGFMEVLATAGGQMFFSLSLAMGAMITYGSYLHKKENLQKNALLIIIMDTMVALMAGLCVMPARFFLPARLPLCAGLLYLALPLLLFLLGWVHPAFSVPLCAALACGLYACARHLPAQRFPLSGRGLAVLGLLSFFCLMLVLLCGFTGHCQQHADFIIRNAVYEHLAANSWPLVTEDGHHFIYYLGHWLPPALAASFCPESWTPWLLALWTFLGLELALLAATVRWGIRKTDRWALILSLIHI